MIIEAGFCKIRTRLNDDKLYDKEAGQADDNLYVKEAGLVDAAYSSTLDRMYRELSQQNKDIIVERRKERGLQVGCAFVTYSFWKDNSLFLCFEHHYSQPLSY